MTRLVLATLAMSALSPVVSAQGMAREAQQPALPQAGQPVASASKPIRLSYLLYGHGFHVLDVVVDLNVTPYGYSVRLNDHTTGFLGFMLHTNVTSTVTGRFKPGEPGVQPVRFESSGYSRGAQRDAVLVYVDGNPKVEILTPPETRRDPVSTADARGSIDTLSAMADMVHQVRQTGRCDGKARVFDGLRLTQVSSHTVGQQTVPPDDRSPFGGSALRCDFESLEIGGFLHNADEAKMRQVQHGTAWVSVIVPGAPALPVRIMFETPQLGMATMFLVKVEQNPALGE